jgi:hypothetical protein
LILMLLAGVGLTVYRWPWVETNRRPRSDPFGPEATTTEENRVTYRRNWRGMKMKHGPAQKFLGGKLWSEQYFYDGELQGPERDFNREGQVTREKHFRSGQVHGAFRVGDGKAWLIQGQYERGERNGAWQYLVPRGLNPDGAEYVIRADPLEPHHHLERSVAVPQPAQLVRGEWSHNQRHGKWSWETDGKVTHTEEFDHDELVRWNGKPIVADFWQWVQEQNDPQLSAELAAANMTNWNYSDQSYGSILHRLCFEADNARVFVYPHKLVIKREPERRGRLIPALCEFAARNDLAFVYRYGGLWLVHEGDQDKPFLDPTGVDKIAFAAGSRQERAWNEAVPIDSCDHCAGDCLENVLGNSEIQYEVRNLDLTLAKFHSLYGPHERLFTVRRRDALGFVLYLIGCRCELRGQTLVIQPQQDRAPEQASAWPLMPVQGFRP